MMIRLLALFLFPVAAVAQDSREVFRGEIPAGSWLRIRTMQGDIDVREGSGASATVTAARGNRDESIDAIRFEVKRDGSNVTICAIFPQTTRCDADSYDSRWRRGDERIGKANFTVHLPQGVKVLAATGNGDVGIAARSGEVKASSGNGEVSVSGAGGRVDASTGNGDVDVADAAGPVKLSSGNGDLTVTTTTGPVSGSTGNGRIKVRMARLAGAGDMKFSTGNGSIELMLPSDFSADVVANVAMRNFESEFPMQIEGRLSGHRIEGRIGKGGRRIELSTGNGRVSLRKSN